MGLIYKSFDDLEGLKSAGMTGPGWVWPVVDITIKSLAVVATYGPGTMLVRSWQHRRWNGINEIDLLLQASRRPGRTGFAGYNEERKH